MATAKGKGRKDPTIPTIRLSFQNHLTIEDRVRIIRYVDRVGGKIPQAQAAWRKELKTVPPSTLSFYTVVRKFNETGSVADRPRGQNPELLQKLNKRTQFIRETLLKNPNTTIKSLAQRLGVSKATISKIKMENRMHSFHNNSLVKDLKKKIADVEEKIDIAEGRRRANVRKDQRGDAVLPVAATARVPNVEPEIRLQPTKRKTPSTKPKDGLPLTKPKIRALCTNPEDHLPPTNPKSRAPRTKAKVRLPRVLPKSCSRETSSKSGAIHQPSPRSEFFQDDEGETDTMATIEDLPTQDLTFSLSEKNSQVTSIDFEEVDEEMIDNLEIYEMTEEEFNQVNTAGELTYVKED